MDIIVSPEALGDMPGQWGITPLNGGVWRTASGLHVAWKASVAVMVSGKLTTKPWLFVATFDPESGTLRALRRLDVLPAGSTSADSNIRAASGSSTETFAASLRSSDVANHQPRDQTLYLGRLDTGGGGTEVNLGWKSDSEDVPDVGWDGEAFAVHAKQQATGDLFVVRVNLEGQTIQPSTRYGSTGSPGGMELGYRMSTSAPTGMSYLFDAVGPAGLSGHDRSGRPVSWAANQPLVITLPDWGPVLSGASRGNLAADQQGGVWLAWTEVASPNDVGIAAHLTSSGEVDRSFTFAQHGAFRAPGISATSNANVWIAESRDNLISFYEFLNGTMTAARTLIPNPYGPNDLSNIWETGDFYAFDWNGERWLAFSETGLLHVIKVAGDCTYRAAMNLQLR